MDMTKLKDVLHFYLHCDVQYPDSSGKMVIARFTGFSREDGIETTYKEKQKIGMAPGDYLSWKPNKWHNCDANHLKPILRKLSSMTQDEARELFKIVFPLKELMPIIEYNDVEKMWVSVTRIPFGHRVAVQLDYGSAEQFQFLLSKGFDLFSLIESGQALERT